MTKENQSSVTPGKRTLSITRLLDAPRYLVWEVWTNPEHIQHRIFISVLFLWHKKLDAAPLSQASQL